MEVNPISKFSKRMDINFNWKTAGKSRHFHTKCRSVFFTLRQNWLFQETVIPDFSAIKLSHFSRFIMEI